MIKSLIAKFRTRFDDTEAWLDAPAGCCECGTGGPYYDGSDGPAVTKYAYVGATDCGRSPTAIDWTACSRHPIEGMTPVVVLFEERVISSRELDELAG